MNDCSVLLEFSLFFVSVSFSVIGIESYTEINVEVEMEIFINFLDTFRFSTSDIQINIPTNTSCVYYSMLTLIHTVTKKCFAKLNLKKMLKALR